MESETVLSQHLTLAPAQRKQRPAAFLTFTLHAHLPFVVNHGTWPHGIEWLHEAAAETYLPLLRVLANLERDGIALHLNLVLSPILLEQLAHPIFRADFPNYIRRKVCAAGEDEAFFLQSGEHQLAETARFWQRFFTQALEDFEAFDRNIIQGFRRFSEDGQISLVTSAASHGYLPLLGTDESVRAQVRTAVATHQRHFGSAPAGIWSPECGYRPAGAWKFPVEGVSQPSQIQSQLQPKPQEFDRIGIEQAFSESGLDFFFVDTHLVEESERTSSSHLPLAASLPADDRTERMTREPHRALYQAYFVESPSTSILEHSTTVFPRDPRSAIQIWSSESGYPADPSYLDFHKKRFPGGHRYWKVTGPGVDIADKQPYSRADAAARIQSHASHFVDLVYETLKPSFDDTIPPVLCAPFDAELFGHWWFEGPEWLETVARLIHERASETGVRLSSCAAYLKNYPRVGFLTLHEGSWGAEGGNQVWMNPETSWTYTHIYPAELATRAIATAGKWRGSESGTRIVKQLCRELLLLESSDWQFLITTGAARDYAERRFLTHQDEFSEVKTIYDAWQATGSISPAEEERLSQIELRDSIFADIDPSFWVEGAHATRTAPLREAVA
jgi:1,4-alpha-glucan branching enzyme